MDDTKNVNTIPGLTAQDTLSINQVLSCFGHISEAIVFGSRAKGNYKPGSDVDISIKGQQLEPGVVMKISSSLNEETLLPYFFDVVNYHSIKSIELKEHIDRVEIVFYRKSLKG